MSQAGGRRFLVRATLRSIAVFTCLVLLGSAAYSVRPGDTLSSIASRLGLSVQALAQANALPDPDRLVAGRTLQVPGAPPLVPGAPPLARTHVVASGENLTTIARRYGVALADLAAVNRLDARGMLQAGTRLAVPASPVGGGSSLPARLAASPQRRALVPVFRRWAAANGIPADLLMATTWLESGWQNTVVSRVGAVGIGQLMPDTVSFVRGELIGVPTLDARRAEDNIRMSARYLRFLLANTGGDVRLALAGYYQGLRSVRSTGMYPGTILYVDGVQALRPRFRS